MEARGTVELGIGDLLEEEGLQLRRIALSDHGQQFDRTEPIQPAGGQTIPNQQKQIHAGISERPQRRVYFSQLRVKCIQK